jgi:hypothetical protein
MIFLFAKLDENRFSSIKFLINNIVAEVKKSNRLGNKQKEFQAVIKSM